MRSGSTLSDAEIARRARQSGLGSWGLITRRETSQPRYATKCLSDEDIRFEIDRGAEGGFLDALMAEASKRGLEV